MRFKYARKVIGNEVWNIPLYLLLYLLSSSNFSNSESQQEETATEKNADPAPDELLRDIIQNEHRIFRRPIYLFRHKSRPVRLARVILKIVRTSTGYKISCTTPNNTQIMCHLNVEQEVTVYKNSVTWTTQTDYFPSDRSVTWASQHIRCQVTAQNIPTLTLTGLSSQL